MKTGLTHIAGLETLTKAGKADAPAIVLLHGYGANMHDLFPLWELWDEGDFNWYFPNGVQSLNMGGYEGRAWFSIDIAKLEEAMRTGSHREMKTSVPPEFDSTMKLLEGFLSELMKKHQTIVLGGFSQGAMCASHLAFKENLQLKGLVLLSGSLLAEDRIPSQAKGIPFYQSHGTRDPILAVEGAKELEAKLSGLNFNGKLHTFNGGHEIPPSVIQEVKNFLSQYV